MLISLIIPVYNSGNHLRECLESVRACPSQDAEFIIVNDGSTDSTPDICSEYKSMDKRFRVIDKQNTGVSESRNMGMAAALGEYIFFLDADDYIDTAQWPAILGYAENGEYDLVAFSYYDLFEDGTQKEEKFQETFDLSLALLSTPLLNTCWGKLLRRETAEKNNLLFRKELKTCEDAVFILDFASCSGSYALSGVCALYYRVNPDGVMRQTGFDDKLRDFAALFGRRGEYLAANYSKALEAAMYRQFFSVITDLYRTIAQSRRIAEIRIIIKHSMRNPSVTAIMRSTKARCLSPFYKKCEFIMMKLRFCLCLAVYFKIKGKYRQHDSYMVLSQLM